jgi:hypothetical protein
VGTEEHEGWILIQSSGRVNANILFGRSDGGAMSVIPLQRLPMTNIVFPFAYNGYGSSMELSFVNAGPSPSEIGISVVQSSGITLAADHFTIFPGAGISRSLHQLLPEIQKLAGAYVYVSAPQPVFGTAVVWSDDGTTASNFTPQQVITSFRQPPLSIFAVTGRVTLNDSPAKGFQVVLSGPVKRTAISDVDGLYAFTNLPTGNYSMGIDQTSGFIAAQVNVEITSASIRQDFPCYTATNEIVVQPRSVAIKSPDMAVDVFGNDFSDGSQVLADDVRLKTTFVNSTYLKAIIPGYMLSKPALISIRVSTGDQLTRDFSFAAFQGAPTLTGIVLPGDMPEIFEGNAGATITLNGTGFLPGLIVKVNGSSNGIQVTVSDSTQAMASVPGSYFRTGGIYPVTVQNSNPSSIESNIQLLPVYYRSPEVQAISPNRVTVKLEPGQGSVAIEIFGFGFKRGALALFEGQPLSTSYCENDAYCLSTHLYASIPASLLRSSGYAGIAVRNPSPTLGSSGVQILEILGLQPTITSVLPGSAAIRDTSMDFEMPILVSGANFGPQTAIGVSDPAGKSSDPKATLLSSTQILIIINVEPREALGTWQLTMMNPNPGGGTASRTFVIVRENFEGNPFLISMSPTVVAAGGPGFTLTINGTNFQPGAQVQFYTVLLPATVVGNVVTADIPAYLIQSAGKFPISIINPGTAGNSNRLYLDVQ